jgi:hypothetical protein
MRVIRTNGFSETDKVLAQTIALRVVQTLRLKARDESTTRRSRERGADQGCLHLADSERAVGGDKTTVIREAGRLGLGCFGLWQKVYDGRWRPEGASRQISCPSLASGRISIDHNRPVSASNVD